MRLIRFWAGRTVQYRAAVPAPIRHQTRKPHTSTVRRRGAYPAPPSPPRCGYLKPESKERRAATCRNGTATCRDVPVRGTEPALTVEQFTCQKAGPHNSAISDGHGTTSVQGRANFSHLALVDHAWPQMQNLPLAGTTACPVRRRASRIRDIVALSRSFGSSPSLARGLLPQGHLDQLM